MAHRSRPSHRPNGQKHNLGAQRIAQHFDAVRALVRDRGLKWTQAQEVVKYLVAHGRPLPK